MKIRDLLKMKGRPVVTIRPDETVRAAVMKLSEYDRGSLPVVNKKEELVGIITERDIVRKACTRSDSPEIKVQDVMTGQVAIGLPDDDVEYAISVMKQKRIRHLPIVENQKVIGLISMRDLLDIQLSEAKAEIRYAGLLPRRSERRLV